MLGDVMSRDLKTLFDLFNGSIAGPGVGDDSPGIADDVASPASVGDDADVAPWPSIADDAPDGIP
jgi:hypothetical protein